jgi:hypothetical protein
MHLVTVKKCFVKGTEDDFKGKTQNTSYIERFKFDIKTTGILFAKKNIGLL